MVVLSVGLEEPIGCQFEGFMRMALVSTLNEESSAGTRPNRAATWSNRKGVLVATLALGLSSIGEAEMNHSHRSRRFRNEVALHVPEGR